MITVLFVCLGNICRSPAAEAIMKDLAQKNQFRLKASSCGVGAWNLIGESPHPLMQEAANKRGLILSSKAKVFDRDFFDKFDYILTATKEIQDLLIKNAQTSEHKAKIHLMTAFSTVYKDKDIQDPFNGNLNAFDETLDMLEVCCKDFLEHIKT